MAMRAVAASMLLLLAFFLAGDTMAAGEATPPAALDRIRLKSGSSLQVEAIDGDYFLASQSGLTRKVDVKDVAELQVDSTDPQFWVQVTNSALKCGNGRVAFDAATKGRGLDRGNVWLKSVLDYPQFSKTALDLAKAIRDREALAKARVEAKARCTALMGGTQTTKSGSGSVAGVSQGGRYAASGSGVVRTTDNKGVVTKEADDAWADLNRIEGDADNAAKNCARLEGELAELCFAMWHNMGVGAVTVARSNPSGATSSAPFVTVVSPNAEPVPATPAPQPQPPAQQAVTESSTKPAVANDAKSADTRVHTVAKGDTLALLAKRYYGNANQWRIIAQVNGLTDVNNLKVGMKLVIP